MVSNRFWSRCSIVVFCVFTGLHGGIEMNAVSAATTSWTQFQGDAAHTGYVPITVQPSAIQPLWNVSATALGQTHLVPGAATDARYVYMTGYDDNTSIESVLALNPTTGSKTWSRPFVRNTVFSLTAPSTGNGLVYVDQMGESPDLSPKVCGLNPVTGNIVFSTTYSAQWSGGSRPTVTTNQVFVPNSAGLNSYNALT
jgi:outer membrane protein assembly factor BamB